MLCEALSRRGGGVGLILRSATFQVFLIAVTFPELIFWL